MSELIVTLILLVSQCLPGQPCPMEATVPTEGTLIHNNVEWSIDGAVVFTETTGPTSVFTPTLKPGEHNVIVTFDGLQGTYIVTQTIDIPVFRMFLPIIPKGQQ